MDVAAEVEGRKRMRRGAGKKKGLMRLEDLDVNLKGEVWSGRGKETPEVMRLNWRGSGVGGGGHEEGMESVLLGKAEGGDRSGTGRALFVAFVFVCMSCS